jgi:GNAT superfamily N-acetyltransferase
LYVVPNARGTGTGRALLEACIAFSRDGGYRRVVLDTHRHRLKAAYDLYCRLGFRECEPYAAAEYACPTFMELQLAGE